MSYNDDAKMKLLKEAWNKMSEGDITYGSTKEDKATDAATSGSPASGTAKNVRTPLAKATAGAENLAEGEEEVDAGGAPVDTGAPVGADDMAGGETDVGADMGAAPVGSPWDQLVAAVEQMKVALEAIAAEESGEAEHMGGAENLGAEGDMEAPGAPEEDIGAVAEQYLESAKKKLDEKKKKVCKEESCEEGAAKAVKGFKEEKKGPFKGAAAPFKKK